MTKQINKVPKDIVEVDDLTQEFNLKLDSRLVKER
jgi:hypothetical protein